MADNTEAIARIRRLLASGVTSTSIDGVSTTIDPASLRAELSRLEAEDTTQQDRRPRVFQILADCF